MNCDHESREFFEWAWWVSAVAFTALAGMSLRRRHESIRRIYDNVPLRVTPWTDARRLFY